MVSIDPSIQRRRREYVSSGVPLSTESVWSPSALMTLSDFVNLVAEKEVDGPHEQREIHLVGKYLGSGAQFDVYGHQHIIEPGFPLFDEPYVSSWQKVPTGAGQRPVVVAIKRPTFKLPFRDHDAESSAMGFGTPSQLHALELEVRALCDDAIRAHRNIVKLLAWGLEKDTFHAGVEPLSPFLVLEHGNCSLSDFLGNVDKGTIPWQVLQSLALDVSQGLSVLHASNIIHGDLKTDNVLVFPDQDGGPFFCIAKLSDFGLSVLEQAGEVVFDLGTRGWQPPELPSDEGIAPEMLVKCDYFSLGLVIFSTILKRGEPPLRGSNGDSAGAIDLVRSCLALSGIPQSPRDRISRVSERLLQRDPADRGSDLAEVTRLLAHVDEEPFDSEGSWYVTASPTKE